MLKTYLVRLKKSDRMQLERMVRRGRDSARRLARVEIHHTPKHGSWMNVAEIELSVLGKRLKHRVGRQDDLIAACSAFERERNEHNAGVNWRFTAGNARIKLQRLYPTIQA